MIKQVILKVRLFVALKDLVAISNGSIFKSQTFYNTSMGSVPAVTQKKFKSQTFYNDIGAGRISRLI